MDLEKFAESLLQREADARALALVVGERRGLLRAARLAREHACRASNHGRPCCGIVAEIIENEERRLPRGILPSEEIRREAEERGEWPREATRRDLAEEPDDAA